MARTFLRGFQTTISSVLSRLGLGADQDLKLIAERIDKDLQVPFGLFATFPTPDAILNIRSSKIETADEAGESAPPINLQLINFPASTINFQTGATTGGTIDITLPNITVGQFVRAGFTYLPNGTLKIIFSGAEATVGALPDPGTLADASGDFKGYLDLESTAANAFKSAGSATNIIENKVGANNTVVRVVGNAGGGGTGGGGGGANWVGDALETFEFGEKVLKYTQGDSQNETLFIKVPQGYIPAQQIKMFLAFFSPSTTNNFKMQTTTSLVRKNTDAVSSTTNQNVNDTGDFTNTVANQFREGTLELTDSIGEINSVAVSPGDLLRVDLERIAPAPTEDSADIRFIPSSTEVNFG